MIELTPEQRQALETLPDGPIGVVDPASRREYVLVSREQFDKLRQPESVSPPPPPLPVRPVPPVPQRLADLPTPPEVTEEARRQYARWWKRWGRTSLARIEQELKLQYYYGGRLICYLRNKEGPEIVIVHNGDDEEFHRQYRALTPEQRKRAVSMGLPVWMDDVTEMSLAVWSYE
jgi:hypothetical protein